MNFWNFFLKKIENNKYAFKDFLDKLGFLHQTLLILMEKYFKSFTVDDEAIIDPDTKNAYMVKDFGGFLSLMSLYSSNADIRSGVCLFDIGHYGTEYPGKLGIIIMIIEDGILTRESFMFDISKRPMCIQMETSVYDKNQFARMRQMIESGEARSYTIAASFVGEATIQVIGQYTDGMVTDYSIIDTSFRDKKKMDRKGTGLLYAMPPYDYHNRYIEDRGYLDKIRDKEQAVR